MLPQHPEDVPTYLETRLDTAFAYFLEREKGNPFAKVGKEGWELSKDPAEEVSSAKREQLEKLKNWLSQNMRTIKLPDLLIERSPLHRPVFACDQTNREKPRRCLQCFNNADVLWL